jgi:transcriptional regulator with XRE-family HTH domain
MRLRSAREARGRGVRELARQVGCSAGHISQVERGIVEPSVSLLIAIVAHLGVTMESIFGEEFTAEPHEQGETNPLRPGTSHRYIRSRHERQEIHLRSGVRAQLLLPTPEDGLDFCEYVYEPHASTVEDGALIRHPGREYGVVLEGNLNVQINFHQFVLHAGDSIALDSGLPHRYWNDSSEPVRAVWVTLHK